MNTQNVKKFFMINLLFILSFCLSVFADVKDSNSTWPYENETKQQRDARMEWWRDARFGMFIHWGVYSVPAGAYDGKQIKGIGEWIMLRGKIPIERYKQYATEFNPVKYDPDAWVKLAKEAGMKYIVITSKHHDGFALFDSKVTDWDVVDATPYGKDLLKPLAKACRKYDMKLGFYYSQAQDWTHKGGAPSKHWDPSHKGDMTEYIKNIAVPQVKEILTNYGDVAVIWWDTPREMTKERADLLQPLLKLQPGIITNNRLGGGYKGDFSTPEQKIPATGLDYDWETCMTMNKTWGYKSYDDNWKSTEMLLRNLVDIASKGGNYLLNVGPTSLGEIPQPSIERLKEIGKWMKVNGDSIYATTASPFAKLTWGRCTKKIEDGKTTLYLHVFEWPTDGKLLVPGLRNKIEKAYLLENKKSLETKATDQGVIVSVPESPLDKIDTVLVLEIIKGELMIEKAMPKLTNGTITLSAALAGIDNPGYGEHAKIEKVGDQQHIGFWTDKKVKVSWDFKTDKAGTYDIQATMSSIGDSVFQLKIGQKKVTCKTPATGSYQDFKQVSLGSIEIEKPGTYTLQITPDKNWKPINLRSVELKLE